MEEEKNTQTVTIEMPQEQTISTPDQQAQIEPEKKEISLQKIVCNVEKCEQEFSTVEAFQKHLFDTHQSLFIKKAGAGRPCSFCKQGENYLKKVQLYVEYCNGKVDGKIHIPFIEELCGFDYMDIVPDTFEDWVKNVKPMPHDPNHKPQWHEQLSRAVKRLKQKQKLLLLRRTLTTEGQVAGAIFQLKANHGMVETEKRLFGQDKDSEPLQIEIVGEDRKRYVEEN